MDGFSLGILSGLYDDIHVRLRRNTEKSPDANRNEAQQDRSLNENINTFDKNADNGMPDFISPIFNVCHTARAGGVSLNLKSPVGARW